MNEREHGRHEIEWIAHDLKLPQGIVNLADRIFLSTWERQLIKGRSVEDVAAACLYKAARSQGEDIQITTIADAVGIASQHLGRIVDDIPPRPWREYSAESFVNLLALEMEDEGVYVDTEMREYALECLEWMDTEDDELACAAGALAYAIEAYAGPPSVIDIAELVPTKTGQVIYQYERLHERNNDRPAA